MIDVRTARSGAARSGGITRIVQVAGARKVHFDSAVAMDVDIAGARHRAFALVASEAVSVAVDGLIDVASPRQISLERADLSLNGSLRKPLILELPDKSISISSAKTSPKKSDAPDKSMSTSSASMSQ